MASAYRFNVVPEDPGHMHTHLLTGDWLIYPFLFALHFFWISKKEQKTKQNGAVMYGWHSLALPNPR